MSIRTAAVIKVLIVDDSRGTLDSLQKLLSFEPDIEVVGTALNGEEAITRARELRPNVVLMDFNMPVLDGIEATRVLAEEAPRFPVIMMSVQGDREYLHRAMRSGASEFLMKPFSGDELVASLHRVHRLHEAKRAHLLDSDGPSPVPAAESVPPDDTAPAATNQGKIIFVYSGKGGVGKSLIAVNLAVSMAKETRARVALVDLDLQFGDIAMLLNLDASHGISDLIENIDHLDHAFIQEIMVDGPLGLKLLLAPVRPELADLVMVDHVWRILSELRDMFDYIVVDSNGNLDDINLELIDLAHRIVVVTSGSLPSIKNTKLALKTFDSLAIPPDRILLVLNQPEAYSEFNTENVEANLRFPISLVIPNDTKLAVRSANRGEPFATKQPDAKISQKIRELVGTIIPEALASRARQ